METDTRGSWKPGIKKYYNVVRASRREKPKIRNCVNIGWVAKRVRGRRRAKKNHPLKM